MSKAPRLRGGPFGPAFASLVLVTGLGDVLNGRPRQGVRLLAFSLTALLLVPIGWALASSIVHARWLNDTFLALLFGIAVGIRVFAGARAWSDGRELVGTPYPSNWYRLCLSFFIVGSVLTLVTTHLIRTIAVQGFRIASPSMLPALDGGDHIIVNKLVYGAPLRVPYTQLSFGRLPALRAPQPGDVVTFILPTDRSKEFVKRVVAIEGQTVEVRRKAVYVDGKRWTDPPGATTTDKPTKGDDFGPLTVPADTVFVLGDNRDQSYDSRYWGPLPVADIEGQAMFVYWSSNDRGVQWSRIGETIE